MDLALAKSSVWKVSKGENYFYLGGTIHILSKSDHPLPQEFNIAYQDANTLVFETDLNALQTPEFASKSATEMSYKDDRNLKSELDNTTYQKLNTFLISRNISIENLSKFKPWAVSLILTMLEYQRLGLIDDYGVDQYFYKQAIADHKTIIGLESADEQLGFLTSLESIEPNKYIEYMLRDIENLSESIDLMREAWRSGNIEKLLTIPSVVEMNNDFPDVNSTLITNRNDTWMNQLSPFLTYKNRALILVGTLHLSGKDGLLNQLKAQGFTVEHL